jgi:hypothetical protein
VFLNVLAAPTKHKPAPAYTNHNESPCKKVRIPNDQVNRTNNKFNGNANSYHESEIDGRGFLNLYNKNPT